MQHKIKWLEHFK